MRRLRSEGGLKGRALLYVGMAPLVMAICSCSYINTPAPGVFGNGTPEEDFAFCSVVRTECSGWAADGTCPASNLVPLVSFQASLCVPTTSENNVVDANNACKEFCGAALYPLAGDSRASCSATLFNMETAKQTGQCTLASTSPGATSQADCDLGGRVCQTSGDGTQSCPEMPFGALHFTPCFDPSKTTAEDVCENGQQFPPATPGGPSIPDQFPWWRVNLVTPNAAACVQNVPVGAVTSFGIDAVTIGTAVAFGTTVPVVAKGGFMTTSVHCDSDNEFCSTTLDDLQVQLADISAGGFTFQNPVARLVAPAVGSLGSIPAGGMTLQIEGDLPLGHARLVTSTAQPVAIAAGNTSASLTGQLSGFFNITPQKVAPFSMALNVSGSTTSSNANCSGETVQQQFLGFELLQDWSAGQGATVSLTPNLRTQGCFGMQVGGSGYRTVNSSPFATPLSGTTSTLALDVYIPPNQPNQFWLGAVQLYLTCPSANVINQYIGQAELTGKPVGQFSTVTYPIPGPVESILQGQHPDCFFSMAVNMNQTPTSPVVDNLRFK